MESRIWTMCAALMAVAIAGAQGTPAPDEGAGASSGPVRLARISYAEGDVSWRPDDNSAWSQATPNLPLQQGAEVWVSGRARAELQFDDGSEVRLGNGAVATLQTLYSDSQGEFTEIKLNDGTSSVHLKDKYSIYQIDTPFESVKAAGPGRFRVDVGSTVAVGVRTGTATITASGGDTRLRSGDFVELRSANDPLQVQDLPREDSFDRFDDSRDIAMAGGTEHVPANIAIVAGGIGHYGHWRFEGGYGWVWCPSVATTWRPYYYGHWVWCNPFGWTWVSDEPWGWAPYHYGTWAHFGWGWGWCPGPYHQYWSPAVVSFTYYNGDYCWAPLCPEEVVYPGAFSIGFGGGDWWFNFSIGCCGVYRPGFGGRCEPYAFGPRDWDRRLWADRWREAGTWGIDNNRFVPRNAAWGASAASEHNFAEGGRFREIRGSANQYFERGQSVMAANHAFSGPVNATLGRASMTPTHTFSSTERPAALNRSLYRAPVSSNIARSGAPFGRTVNMEGTSRRAGRSGTYIPGNSNGSSSVERARRSLGYSGRGAWPNGGSSGSVNNYSRIGDRVTQGSTGFSRGIQRSSSGASAVERARQSLGYSYSEVRGSNERRSNRSTGSYSGSGGQASSGAGRGRDSNGGSRYRNDSQSSYGRAYRSDRSSNSNQRSNRDSNRGSRDSNHSSRDNGGSHDSDRSRGDNGGGGNGRGH